MDIRYKKKFVLQPLIFGLLYLLIGAYSSFFSENRFLAFFLPLSLFYLLESYIRQTRKFMTLKPDEVRINGLSPKKMRHKDIIDSGIFAGDYKLKSHKKELVIDKNLIAESDLQAFHNYFESLKQKETKTNRVSA